MKEKSNLTGVLYFLIHFMLEVISFYCLSSYTNSNIIWYIALLYDFLAFVPQGIFGYFKDIGIKANFSIIGTVLLTIALICMYFNLNTFLVIIILAIGNCMVHIQGAETTLTSSKGKISPCAIFVSGGSFGVITGKLLAMYKAPIPYIILVNLLMIIPIIICQKYLNSTKNDSTKLFNYSNKKIDSKIIIAIAVFVVIVRSYMGYGIPTTWNKTLMQTVLLFCFLGIGKALGGILIDSIGIRKTSIISTIGALPFLLLGNNIMIISLIGLMMFSMTMPITLSLIVSELKDYPGIAFGLTTIGLFLGTIPIFAFRINSILVNCILVSILTLASTMLLSVICRKEET